MMAGYVDMHVHTTASDGLLTPTEVVREASRHQLTAIAITDHDTTGGIEEALGAGSALRLEVVPGVELSTIHQDREVHILGYFIDWNDSRLQQVLSRIVNSRYNRAVKMVDKLRSLGVDISFERVKVLAQGRVISRPHIARAMLEKGYISDIKEAFTADYIAEDGRAYVPRYKISPAEAIDLIRSARGVAVIAHPGLEKIDDSEIQELKRHGLQGVEVFHSEHSREQQQYYYEIAQRQQLLITGGSDFHGDRDERRVLGAIRVPYYLLSRVSDCAGKR